MPFPPALWLPVLLAAVVVFIASSIIHMVLPYHKSSYHKFSDEDKVREAIRASNPSPGLYNIPFCTQKDMNSAEMKAKFTEGPVGHVVILPSGPVFLPKYLIQWFLYCILVGIFVAFLAAHTVHPIAPFRHVFGVAGTAAFLAYGIGGLSNGVWKGYPWKMVLLEAFDGLIYGLLTGACFGWLWSH
jgi:hypothetical protein